ncbi:MAG: hypothetical protein HY795_06710 [Desulfovibrio sp.]|nr:hypothetical protein [Desulfovibrio sp.]MBI4960145.1 hypothetical protein [Desulfovibrio sp.]
MNRKLANGILVLSIAVSVSAGLSVYPDVFNSVHCNCIKPFQQDKELRQKFLSCSNVDQTILYDRSRNVKSEPAEVEGWEIISPLDPELPGMLVVAVRKDRDTMFFYPRLSGSDSRITVFSINDPGRSKLLTMQGGEKWSPISAQYALDLRCVEHGYVKEEFSAYILIELKGRWTQVWHKNGKMLF